MKGSSTAAGSLRGWVQGSLEEWKDGAVAQEEEAACRPMELAPETERGPLRARADGELGGSEC